MRITLLIFGSSRMFAPLKGGLQCISIFGKSQANFNTFSKLSKLLLRQGVRDTKNNIIHHKYSSQAVSKDDFHFPVIEYSELHESSLQKVGVIFDIDGVLVRGRRVIGSAREAISKLKYHNVPILYLTNAGCETEEHKARSLQDHIGVEIDPDQVVLSHSPLRILNILHQKHVVVSGQGPVSEIAQMCGFSKVSHIDDIDQQFPNLDVNSRKKRERMPRASKKPFHLVEGVLLMGEPVHWEKSLQIITDILLTNGEPNKLHQNVSASQIPVVAVNTDYLWMSEAPNARFGHGGFLLCLEAMFEKLANQRLQYTAIIGKPNLFTYRYAEGIIHNLARKMFGKWTKIQTIYGIGDNVDTDIYGANLYNNYLKAVRGSNITTDALHPKFSIGPDRMKSILVKTGVHGPGNSDVGQDVNHLHRDTVYRSELRIPTHVCEDVLHAVDTILEEEKIT